MLRSPRRGLETWHGRDRVTLADERARQQGTQTSTYTGAPVLDPTCEGGRVRFPSATRHLELTARLAPRPLLRDALVAHRPVADTIEISSSNLVRRKSVAPGLRAALLDGNELRPVLHLHARH